MIRRGRKLEQKERARQLAFSGPAAAVACLLKTAAETMLKPEVSTKKVRTSADIVLRACDVAILSVSGEFLEKGPGGERRIKGSVLKRTIRAAEAFEKIAAKHLERRQMYCAEFVVARVMACHYALNSLRFRHRLGKEFERLDGVAATFLGKLLRGNESHEATLFAIAEDFEKEVSDL
jgi:hypothetical protein